MTTQTSTANFKGYSLTLKEQSAEIKFLGMFSSSNSVGMAVLNLSLGPQNENSESYSGAPRP